MKTRLIAYAVTLLLRSVSPGDVKELVDDLLDRVEDKYTDNPAIIGIVNLVRQAADIPDDIGGDED